MDGSREAEAGRIFPDPSSRRVLFSSQAQHSLDLRDISRAEVERVILGAASGKRVDRTGNVVFRSGDVGVLAEPRGGDDLVIAALRPSELDDDAE